MTNTEQEVKDIAWRRYLHPLWILCRSSSSSVSSRHNPSATALSISFLPLLYPALSVVVVFLPYPSFPDVTTPSVWALLAIFFPDFAFLLVWFLRTPPAALFSTAILVQVSRLKSSGEDAQSTTKVGWHPAARRLPEIFEQFMEKVETRERSGHRN